MAESSANPPSGCSYFDAEVCRSCSLLPTPYEAQLSSKETALRALLPEKLHGALLPIVRAHTPFGSRNKAKLAVGGTSENPILGFPSREGVITPVPECPLHLPMLHELTLACRKGISSKGLTPYDTKRRTGELKYLIMRGSESTHQMMLRLVLRSERQFPLAKQFLSELSEQFPSLKVTSLNLQPHPKAVVEGEKEEVISKAARLEERLGEVRLLYSPQSFSQVTSSVAEQLYRTAAKWLAESSSRTLLDLFCGVGAFSLFAAPHLEEGLGIELSQAAIGDANAASELNNVRHLSFQAVDVDTFFRKELRTLKNNYHALIVNPPRRGLSRATIDAIKAIAPKTLLYSSCNAESLVRDLRELGPDFTVQRLQPFDMFPNTEHFETLVELTR